MLLVTSYESDVCSCRLEECLALLFLFFVEICEINFCSVLQPYVHVLNEPLTLIASTCGVVYFVLYFLSRLFGRSFIHCHDADQARRVFFFFA